MIKYCGLYRCPDDVKNFKLRIKIKQVENFKEQIEDSTQFETKIFHWQQKIYGKYERDFYKDEKNCITDLDKKYHFEVLNLDKEEEDSILFSYVDADNFIVNDEVCTPSGNINKLCEYMSLMSINRDRLKSFDYEKSLNNALNSPLFAYFDQVMYLMADFGEYFENTWLKSEQVLCTLKYNTREKILAVYPDFTTDEPYCIEAVADTTKNYIYYIENASERLREKNNTFKDLDVLDRGENYKKNKADVNLQEFMMPDNKRVRINLFLEILEAKNFEYENFYVQYYIDLNEKWICFDVGSLRGCTQASISKGRENVAYFGFPFEICFECNIEEFELSQPPFIYFEVISKDSWNRFRTEGLTYKAIPILKPGCYNFNLQCFRFHYGNPIDNMRRFFIGDYLNYNDLSWIGVPKNYEENIINKFGVETTGTGMISIKMNILHHSQAFTLEGGDQSKHKKILMEKLNSSTLLRSVARALKAFERARKIMVEVREKVD